MKPGYIDNPIDVGSYFQYKRRVDSRFKEATLVGFEQGPKRYTASWQTEDGRLDLNGSVKRLHEHMARELLTWQNELANEIIDELLVEEKMHDALVNPEWEKIWRLLNAYASGETQQEYARMEPIAILADVYARLAHIDELRKTALAAEEARLERARSQV